MGRDKNSFTGYTIQVIDSEHPLRLLRARDIYGRFLFIYEFSGSDHIPEKFPELNGIDIHLQGPEQSASDNYMLLLVLKENKEWQIFLSLCNDLVASTKIARSENRRNFDYFEEA